MKRKLWHSCLSASDKKHLKEDAGCNLRSKDAFIRTRTIQKEDWIKCDCCGKLMYKGFELNNGHRIGRECETSVRIFKSYKIETQKQADFFSITKKQFNYLSEQSRN